MNEKSEFNFPCGLFVTDVEKNIVFVNDFFKDQLGYSEKLVGLGLDSIFTKASLILFESYLYPQLIVDRKVEELQATIFDGSGKRFPVVINALLQEDTTISWSMFISINRNTLYEELLTTREQLETHVEQLKLMADTDDLTGLLNRREALSRIEKLLQHSFRQNKHLSIILLDVDFFKKVNDKYGHSMGDKVLVAIAEVLKSEARATDVAARWGGEEFLISLYDSDTNSSFAFSKRIQSKISKLSFFEKPVTVSCGIASYIPDNSPPKSSEPSRIILDIINNADTALYSAKDTGRNKSVIYLNEEQKPT
jgi:diguanylate cyclase (GGDEF)-like protein